MALKQGATPMSMMQGMSNTKKLPTSQTTKATGVSQAGTTKGAKSAAHIPTGTNR